MHEDLKKVKDDSKLTVKADKTTNYYKMDQQRYNELVEANVTKTYKKTNESEILSINREAKQIVTEFKLENRIESIAEKEEFINLKDHKQNFANTPVCRLIRNWKMIKSYI